MPGCWINHTQVNVYKQSRKKGLTQMTSATKAGISIKSGRSIEKGIWTDPRKKERHWKTRKDPLEKVWDNELVKMLENNPTLTPKTLFECLQGKYGDLYGDSISRTLQRRVKEWKACYGPEKEVMFRQTHEPGQQGQSDFTVLKKTIVITINGKVFKHILYHFKLVFSRWSYIMVVLGGESHSALLEGLQKALWKLGGAPKEHRTDSLSAAYKNKSKKESQDLTDCYKAFCDTYGMKPTRNNLGKKHENGSVEAAHGHLKRRIEQQLMVRGNNDFASIQEYQKFIDDLVDKHNALHTKDFLKEKEALKKLPLYKAADYTETVVKVTTSSTISVQRVMYSVPSRLIGETLRVRLYHNRLLCYLGSKHIITFDRIRAKKGERKRSIDYRHLIDSLIKKPRAFRHSQIRDDLLPNSLYQVIWKYVDENMLDAIACKFIVGLLHIAAKENCEQALAEHVLQKIDASEPLKLNEIQDHFSSRKRCEIQLIVLQHTLEYYNILIPKKEVTHHV
ncbi:MAG: IS21 family transposase [Ignavibacteriaceae bacterium]|nr:IS21 family transposase [Ignavibacteriaceae bacterium]